MEKEQCLQSSPRKIVNSIEEEIEMAEAPDKGWAWVVACAACMINFIMAGLGRMSGILFVAFIDIYKVDRKSASTPFSVRSSTRNLLGPIVGILGQKYGVRTVTIVGGIIGTLSSAACFFAKDIVWITVLWGGLSGAGCALTVTLPQVTIGQYFKKYRTTAAGMAFSGGCVGSFLFPVLLEQLLQSYGIQGTFLLMAAIIMHTIPAAMILRKPSWLKSRKEPHASVMTSPQKTDLKLEGKEMGSEFSTPGSIDNKANGPDIQFLSLNSKIIVQLLGSEYNGDNQITPVMEACILEEMDDLYSSVQYSQEKHQFYNNIKLVKKSLFNDKLNQNKSCDIDYCKDNMQNGISDVPKLSNDVTKNYVKIKMKEILGADVHKTLALFPKEDEGNVLKVLAELQKLNLATTQYTYEASVAVKVEDSQNELDSSKRVASNTFGHHIVTAFKLYSNPLFLLICFCRAVHFITFVPVMTTVVDFVMDKGLQEHDGKWAIAAISLGDLLGRLCLGWVTDYGFMTLPKYMLVVMLVQGASTAALPLMHTKETLYTGLAVFGMLQGSLFIRHPVLVSKYMGHNEQSIAMGCINFFSGLLGFGLPHFIGYFRDTIGSYDYIFYINGAFGAFIGLMWIFEPYFTKCLTTKRGNLETV